MPFQAFIDDSGSGYPLFVLSGYVSPVDFWEGFSEEWQALLNESPTLKYFKMREAAQLSGQFCGMSVDARNRRIERFFRLIKLGAQAAVISVIPFDPYKKLMKGKIRKEWDDPYFIAIFDLITLLLEAHFRLRISGSVDGALEFIFDENPRLAAKVPHWYQVTRELLKPPLRACVATTPRFENDIQVLPLQAADAQSWYIRRLFAEKIEDQSFKSDLPKELFKPLDEVQSAMSFWGSERMTFVAGVKPGDPITRKPSVRYRDIHDVIANARLE